MNAEQLSNLPIAHPLFAQIESHLVELLLIRLALVGDRGQRFGDGEVEVMSSVRNSAPQDFKLLTSTRIVKVLNSKGDIRRIGLTRV